MTEDAALSPAEQQRRSAALARGLIAGWDKRTELPLVGTRRRPFTQRQLALTHALTAHVHYLAGPALDLLDAGHVLAALPLVRSSFEAALTAQWVTQTIDGAQAFVDEDIRQRKAHVGTLEQAVSQVYRDAAPGIADKLIKPLETSAIARGFHKICADLVPGGMDAYVIYRILSQFSHSTVLVADAYLDGIDRDPGIELRTRPVEPNAAVWTHMLASSLVWAGRSIDFLDTSHARRSELRAAATALGISSGLRLAPAAQQRLAEADRQRRLAAKASAEALSCPPHRPTRTQAQTTTRDSRSDDLVTVDS